ncbi:MAG TPA: TetR-like C-terminal domain-containing protein [bacterium]|nr:TetR-like C-terminal domain-containing protein [bacterium]
MPAKSPYHHPRLRDALLGAALAELKEHGAAGLSLRRIAARAAVSHAAPYRHFRSKEHILAALVWDTQERFTTALRTAREREGTARARLFAVGEAYLAFARRNPERLTLMFSETGMAAMRRFPVEMTTESIRRYDSFGVLEQTVRECQAADLLNPQADSGALSVLVWSMVHGLAAIEREGFLASLSSKRGLNLAQAHSLVMEEFRNLVDRGARALRSGGRRRTRSANSLGINRKPPSA